MYNKNEFEKFSNQIEEKMAKRLQLPVIIRLINKLNENNIEDDKIRETLSELQSLLNVIDNEDRNQKKQYRKSYRILIDYADKTFGYKPKGTLTNMYIGAGLAIGISMFAWKPELIGVGVALGIAFGVAIGTTLEKKAEKEGKIY